jgi:7-carboxy-7-deazaguanine synthase
MVPAGCSNDRMRIAEVFHSIQGEGRLTGVPSVFVRTSGCNLRCWFCDTPYTSWNPEGEERTVESLVDETLAFDCEHVVITGGEPMLVKDVAELARRLTAAGRHITIETAGTVDLDTPAHLMSISPKRANSTPAADTGWAERHDQRRHQPDVIRRLTRDYDYQLKFVVDEPADADDIARYLEEFPHLDQGKVYLMPQAIDREPHAEKCGWLEDIAASRGWQLCRRLHIELFGNKRGT